MDVVDFSGIFLQISIQEALEHTHSQLALGLVQIHSAALGADIPLHSKAFLRTGLGLQRMKQCFGIALGDHTVNGFKDLGIIMDVFQLHQGITGRMITEIHTGILCLQLFIAGFGRCQRVVAVTNRKHHGNALQTLILLANVGGIVSQTGVESLRLFTLHQPAGNVLTAFHQFEIIELFQAFLLFSDGFDEDFVMVITEHQNMGQLNGCIPAHTHTGRNALDNRALRGTDGRGRADRIVISIQIHHAHQALADRAVFQGALYVDQCVF